MAGFGDLGLAALRAITSLGLMPAIAVTLAIVLAVEIAQALDLLGALGLASYEFTRTVLGGAFDWLDLVAYATGRRCCRRRETLSAALTAPPPISPPANTLSLWPHSDGGRQCDY